MMEVIELEKAKKRKEQKERENVPHETLGVQTKWTMEGKCPKEVIKATVFNAFQILKNHPKYMGRIWNNKWDYKLYFESNILMVDGNINFPPCFHWEADSIQREKFWKTVFVEDIHIIQIGIEIADIYEVNFSTNQIYEAMKMVGQFNERDPLKEYIENIKLPENYKPILDTWLIDYFGVEDTKSPRAYAWKTMLGAVARARYATKEKPVKVDTSLILYGAQGIGKSTALQILALKEKWFSDIPFDMGANKEACIKIGGILIYELKELAKRRAKDKEIEKAFLDTRVDTYRPPYNKTTISRPRRTIFIGTTNRLDILQDSTGSRRFFPVVCEWIKIKEFKQVVEQLWAEALQDYKSGNRDWYLNTEEENERKLEAVHFSSIHPWKDEIKRIISNLPPGTRLTPRYIMDGLELPKHMETKGNITTIEMIMRELGYTRKRKRSGNKRFIDWGKQ